MLSALLALSLAADGGVEAPAEFIDDVRLLFQVVTCQDAGLPEKLDAKTVEAYCARQKPRYERYQQHWGTKAKEFLKALTPSDAPKTVVYPFGGGDLMSALTTFPEATEITTLSLELAGDPRRLATVKDAKVLKSSLDLLEEASGSTLLANDSKSVNLSKGQRGELPGQLSMHLMGLALHGFVPTAVRFFRVEDSGALHYYSAAEIAALEGQTAARLKETWKPPDFSPAFANVEVQFAPLGGGPTRTFRHLAANLADDALTKAPGVLKFLESKGRISAMTKAASYLLWRQDFSKIRDCLTSHLEVMFSDSTGIAPFFAKKAGLMQQAYGSYETSFLGAVKQHNDDFRALFTSAKPLTFRYGYPDGSPEKRSHLVMTWRPKPDAGK